MTRSLNIVLAGLFSTALVLGGCSDDASSKSAASTVKLAPASEQPVNKDVVAEAPVVAADVTDLGLTFKDSAKIAPNGKPMIMVFDRPGCKYCTLMREDIANNAVLKEKLGNTFSSYSLNTGNNKMHKILHEGNFMDVDTKTMIDIYGVNATPTIIFSDKSGKSIFVVPGYMPTEQFVATLDFVEQGLWLNKDRKNGEVYEALKNFYISKGIKVNSQ